MSRKSLWRATGAVLCLGALSFTVSAQTTAAGAAKAPASAPPKPAVQAPAAPAASTAAESVRVLVLPAGETILASPGATGTTLPAYA